jgi:tripartite ATP-independent transporter DctP family solute receptor
MQCNQKLLACSVFFLLPALCANGAPKTLAAPNAQPVILQIGHALAPESLYSQSIREFQRRLKIKLGSAVEIADKGNSQIGNEGQLLKKVLEGEPILAIVSPVMTDVDDQFGVFDMPYLILTREHLKQRRPKLLHDFLEPAALKKGVRLLALWENGFRHVTNNVHPIEKPGDLKDIKLRVPTGRWQTVAFKSFGANPIALQFDRVGPALKSGDIDGQENALALIAAQKFYEVQKYLSLTSHTYLPGYFIINEKYYKSLPHNIQHAISLTAKEMEGWVLNLGEKLDEHYREELSKKMIVNEADKFTFIVESIPIYREFAKVVPQGKPLINLMFDKSSMKAQR